MKKLMIAAVTAAVAGGAFALPQVYDYKASVKHLYLQEVPVTVKVNGVSVKYKVYQKYQKTTALKGYLVMDQDGVTSPSINVAGVGAVAQPQWGDANASLGFDYGRNRGFLIVQNDKAWKGVRFPKILPAVLDAKWVDADGIKKAEPKLTGLAEGTLYVGGEAVAPVRPALDDIDGVITQRKKYWIGQGDVEVTKSAPTLPVAQIADSVTGESEGNALPGMVAIADYLWTSVYLFSDSKQEFAFFNGPNWFYRGASRTATNVNSPFGQFEYVWDQNLPAGLRTDWVKAKDAEGQDRDGYFKKTPVNYFHDTWMNGAGVGKWFTNNHKSSNLCCGIIDVQDYNDPRTLDTLSGNLKGGLFLCTENGIDAEDPTYEWFLLTEWEDQFNTARLETGVRFANDVWQNDLWQDGFIDQATTDVIYGTWSIKFNRTFFEGKGKAKPVEVVGTAWQKTHFPAGNVDGKMVMIDETLWKTIYGVALALNSNVNIYDGTEIYAKDIKDRANLPMITPKFAMYYRLAVKLPIN